MDGTEAATAWRLLNPENTQAIVVEDDGKVVGAWLALRIVHAECIWVAPSHRGSFGVWSRLIKGMRQVATSWGVDKVVTGSITPEVTDLIKRFGGVPMPCESFVLPVGR